MSDQPQWGLSPEAPRPQPEAPGAQPWDAAPGGYGQQPWGSPPTGYGQPPAYGQPHGYGPSQRRTNTLAIVALVLAFVFTPAGLVCGYLARGQIRRTGEGGRGLALAAIVIGWIWVAFIVLAIGAVLLLAGSSTTSP